MKSRFQVNDDSDEQSDKEQKTVAQPSPAPVAAAPQKKPAKSRFQEEESEEEKPAEPVIQPPTVNKNDSKAKPKSRFVDNSESEKEESPAKQEPTKEPVKKPNTRFAVEESDKESEDEKQAAKDSPKDGQATEQPEEGAEATISKGKKRRDKKKAAAAAPKEGEGDQPKAEDKPEEAKKKKGKGGAANLDLKRKIEEKRREAEAKTALLLAKFVDMGLEMREIIKEELRDLAAEYRRKVEKQKEKDRLRAEGKGLTKKEREAKEKAERARRMFEESQRQIATQLGQTGAPAPTATAQPELPEKPQIDDAMRGRGGRRRPNAARKEQAEEKAEQAPEQQPEPVKETVQTEEEKPTPAEAKEEQKPKAVEQPLKLDVDDWENFVDETPAAKEETPLGPAKADQVFLPGKGAQAQKEAPVAPKPTKEATPAPKPQDKPAPVPKAAQPVAKKDTPETPPPPAVHDPLSIFNRSSTFRCPIICIMGHVDTGKTKLLDHIRNTNVQSNEAGGITQQIGASFFPQDKLKEEVAKVNRKVLPVDVQIPGLLIIDTPGHESFANLRSRGSSLCDFAIVVIDVIHGVENQTIESIRMLQEKGTPFVIALNKIDRIYQWKPANDQSSYVNFTKQSSFVQTQFTEKYNIVLAAMARLDINIALYWKGEDPLEYVPVVPTSAITGEGVPDLLGYIAQFTQTRIPAQVTRNDKDFKATVLEVKKAEGLGATVDIILVNGTLEINEKIVMSGFDGPIETYVKELLTPHPMKEMRVKNEYLHHQKVYGSIGVRLLAPNLDRAIAGSSVFKYNTQEELDAYAVELQSDIKRVKKVIRMSSKGVGVAASSLGSLEALLVFLKEKEIPVSTICIGDVTKTDLLRVLTPFLQDEGSKKRKLEYLTMLCFDVKILPEALKFGEENGIKMVTAKIIYHLFDAFTKHVQEINEQRKKEEAKKAVFPCILKQLHVFNKKDPIIIGVEVAEGVLRVGTPICAPGKEMLRIGVVESIEKEKNSIKEARRKTGGVAIRIKSEASVLHGRHFELSDDLVSIITRESIDTLKDHFRDEMTDPDWDLVRKLKGVFNIK